MGRHPMAAAMVRRYGEGKIDLDDLAQAATVRVWAHDALRQIDPNRAAAIPCPKRPRGRDPSANVLRDIEIFYAVQSLIDRGFSQRDASRKVARDYPTITPDAIRAIHRKERMSRIG